MIEPLIRDRLIELDEQGLLPQIFVTSTGFITLEETSKNKAYPVREILETNKPFAVASIVESEAQDIMLTELVDSFWELLTINHR